MTSCRLKNKVFRWTMLFLFATSFVVLSHAVAENTDGRNYAAPSDLKRLEGKWQRPDGGYILELKEFSKGGTLKAAYFNPRSINVYKAEWNRKQGVLTVYVELRDVNYPGSKYNLQYDLKTDRLIGTYFQAVHGETYDIEFVRIKE